MRGEPPQTLVSLLARLNLASAAQVRAAAPRVRRLAGELPDFESVWVDALQQARLLTPLQAAQINAGRGESLLRGPYVISHRLAGPHYAECFTARHIDTLRVVRLYCVGNSQVAPAAAAREIARLAEQSSPLRGPVAAVIEDAGIAGETLWAACPAVEGTTAADWMAENGRFPPTAVLHIAREMLARLADLELLGIVHGDVGAAGLIFQPSGHVVLPMPGLRGIVRPSEGYSFNDLPSEAYDYLAPERIGDGSPPTLASDLYACGCLWWHLLAGRPPLGGGNSLDKLKAVHAAKLLDVRQMAADVPEVLAHAINACLERDPAARPASSGELLTMLGPAARNGSANLSRCLAGHSWLWKPSARPRASRRAMRRKRLLAAAGAAMIACASLLALAARHWDRASGPPALAVANSAARRSANSKTPKQPRVDAAEVAARHEAPIDQDVKPAAAVEPVAIDLPAD
jgi:serine/threonine-protein kinase